METNVRADLDTLLIAFLHRGFAITPAETGYAILERVEQSPPSTRPQA